MTAKSAWVIPVLALVGSSLPAEAQQWGNSRRDRVGVARAQGIPPGQLPSADQCRVWYDNRPPGRQPASTSCRQAEAMAARDRNARVIYGENVYWNAREIRYGYGSDDERAVRRGTVRDPRFRGGYGNDGRDTRIYANSPPFQNGYRDGMSKGREDGEDRDRFDVNRHGWYRAANRGYENRYGTRANYQQIYRQGFEAGYAEGYRIYARR